MQPGLTRASSTLHVLTVLACCLCAVRGLPESGGPLESNSTTSTRVLNGSVNISKSATGAVTASEPSATAFLQTSVNSSAETAASIPLSSNATEYPDWLLTQNDYCPASQADLDEVTAQLDTGAHDNSTGASNSSTCSATPEAGLSAEQLHDQQQQQQQQQLQSPQQLQTQDEETDSLEEDRHNFGLSKDGAKIVACNKEAKKCSAILDTDSDTFMKNDCKADKWFIVELSQVAKVDAFQVSQYELYSSRVKDFEMRGRQSHPRGQGSDYSKALNTSAWHLLGKYTAAKTRGSQAFTIAQPVWLKYLQFHFITHYGTEPMCALNDILVFGKSAAEDLEDQLSASSLLPEDDTQTEAKGDNVSQQQETQQQTQAVSDTALPPQESRSSDSQTSVQAGSTKADLPVADTGGIKSNASINISSPHDTEAVNASQGGNTLSEATAQPSFQPAQNTSLDGSNSDAGKASDSAQSDALHEELLLLPNSAGSNKARHGGSIYDMLVQEIKSLKLQQTKAPRQLAELQKNMSSYVNRTTAEITALEQSLQVLHSEVEALRNGSNQSEGFEFNASALAKFSDVDADLRALGLQLESVRTALNIVQHKVTAILLMVLVAWLAVLVLTAPDLGRVAWVLYVPIVMICAIGVLWLAGMIRILPKRFIVQ